MKKKKQFIMRVALSTLYHVNLVSYFFDRIYRIVRIIKKLTDTKSLGEARILNYPVNLVNPVKHLFALK